MNDETFGPSGDQKGYKLSSLFIRSKRLKFMKQFSLKCCDLTPHFVDEFYHKYCFLIENSPVGSVELVGVEDHPTIYSFV